MPFKPHHDGEIQPIEPLSALRAHPEWYFKTGAFERETVISLLLREAFLSDSVTEVSVSKDGDWAAVMADSDWLNGDLGAFSVPSYFPEDGINAMRIEVVLTAFCDTVVTASNDRRDDIEVLRPHEIPDSMKDALEHIGVGRVIVFRAPLSTRPSVQMDSGHSDIFSQVWMDQAIRRMKSMADA